MDKKPQDELWLLGQKGHERLCFSQDCIYNPLAFLQVIVKYEMWGNSKQINWTWKRVESPVHCCKCGAVYYLPDVERVKVENGS